MNNPYQQHPPQQPWGPPPPPQQPKKRSTGKTVGLGCLGILGLFVIIGIIAAIAGGGSDNASDSSKDKTVTASSTPDTDQPSKAEKPAAAPSPKASHSKKPVAKPAPKPKPKVVTFKVWGTAPAGALGGLDIMYGSDSDSRKGTFTNGKFTATLPLNDDAMYYSLTAQLQGSGDINCSVTVDGHTKKGHASGGYNICDAQLSSGLFGGWE